MVIVDICANSYENQASIVKLCSITKCVHGIRSTAHLKQINPFQLVSRRGRGIIGWNRVPYFGLEQIHQLSI